MTSHHLPVRVARADLAATAVAAGIHPDTLRKFVELGLVTAHVDTSGRLWFARTVPARVHTIVRLHSDLAVNYAGIALVLDLLARIEDDGAWVNLVVPRALDRCDLGDADRRLVTELTYGTVRQRRRLDAIIDPFLDRRPAEVAVRALRLGVYQLEVGFPDHAALNTTVGAVPKRWRGLVNAVLRRLDREKPELPARDLALSVSLPSWLFGCLRKWFGQDEALSLADRIVVIKDGRVQQIAPPAEIYGQPANLDVARFMGYRNVLSLDVASQADGRAQLSSPGLRLQGMIKQPLGAKAAAAIRPEELIVGDGPNAIDGKIENVEYSGRDSLLDVITPAGIRLHVIVTRDGSPALLQRAGIPYTQLGRLPA